MHFHRWRRRELITLLGGGAAAAWTVAARAQQPERVRRIGVLTGGGGTAADRLEVVAFQQALQHLGRSDGRNVRIDYRWGLANATNVRRYVAELIALAPDVIFANGASTIAPLLQATRGVKPVALPPGRYAHP